MQQSSTVGRAFLDPTILARIGNLELIAKFVVEGFISGLHKSPYHGFSVEFSQYRQYMPGDDTKHIDWKAYARTDRYYIKQFEEETNLNCYLLLDTSESMAHPSDDEQTNDATTDGNGAGTPRLTKLRYSSFLIASLAYFMAKQRDAVGFAYFDDVLRQYLPARSSTSHLHSILLTLETLQTTKHTRMGTPLHQIAERLTKRGLVLFISDLYDENHEEVIAGLEHLRYEGHEVIVFHVLAEQELEFANFETGRSSEALIRFIDSENDAEIITTPQAIQESYLSNFNDFLDTYRLALRQADIDYNIITTATPIDLALASYLAKRQGVL
ncbi:MAG: DUF58 domain-containing protein [Candidatus Poribacteria bacterium]|nr:DUF58 domain-containing protein [Candidatus Poribacteria bacterium]